MRRHTAASFRLYGPFGGRFLSACRACIAAAAGDIRTALEELIAAKGLGLHAVVERNIEAAQRWIRVGGTDSGRPLILDPDCSFQITRKLVQPVMPGPIA